MSKIEDGVGFASALRADGPRRWDAPPEPGAEVTAVRDRLGWTFTRHDDIWCHVDPSFKHHHMTWLEIFFRYAPLTDATPGADGLPACRIVVPHSPHQSPGLADCPGRAMPNAVATAEGTAGGGQPNASDLPGIDHD